MPDLFPGRTLLKATKPDPIWPLAMVVVVWLSVPEQVTDWKDSCSKWSVDEALNSLTYSPLHCCSRSPIQLYITCHHTQGTCSVTVSTPSDLPIQVFPYSAQRPPRPRQEIERIRPNHVLNWLIKTTKIPSTWQLKSQANNY